MPRISWRGDVTLTLTIDVEATFERGDPSVGDPPGSVILGEVQITGIDGITPSWKAQGSPAGGSSLKPVLDFDDKFRDEVLRQIEDELVLEAKG